MLEHCNAVGTPIKAVKGEPIVPCNVNHKSGPSQVESCSLRWPCRSIVLPDAHYTCLKHLHGWYLLQTLRRYVVDLSSPAPMRLKDHSVRSNRMMLLGTGAEEARH